MLRRGAVLGSLVALCFGLALVACTPEETSTQLLVVVDSDLSLDAESDDALKTVLVTVRSADNTQELVSATAFPLSEAPKNPTEEFRLPLSFALTPFGIGESTLFRVVVTGQNRSGEEIAERQVITTFRTGAALRLDVFLAASCLRELCRAGESRSALTCNPETGACGQVPELVDLPTASGGDLSGYSPSQTRGDADAGAATEEKCASHADCDDGLYCNGEEQCDPGSLRANRLGCAPGIVASCPTQQTCDEASDRCTSCTLVPDGDRDGVNAKACGGSDCNDGDPSIAPNQREICDGKDNDCDEMSDNAGTGGSVCSTPADGGGGAALVDSGTTDAGVDGGTVRADGGSDAGSIDAGNRGDSGPSDAGMDATPDTSVPLVAKCTMGSTAACSSFINAWDAEVPMGSYGSVMEPNVGQGFEVEVSASDNDAGCGGFLGLFGEAKATLDTFSALGNLNLALHTVYRPARWVSGEKYPLIVWGNGTCMQPETYGGHLRSLASQGFIVVAPNSRYVGTGDAMRHALDFAVAASTDAQSPYRGRIDTTKIGVMGHGQGSMASIALATDSRVQGVMMFNGGVTAAKPYFVVFADVDIVATTLSDAQTAINAASKAAFIFYHMVPTPPQTAVSGFLTLVKQPNRVTGPTNAWWKYLLNNDAAARDQFVGASCGLCGRASEFDFGQKGL